MNDAAYFVADGSFLQTWYFLLLLLILLLMSSSNSSKSIDNKNRANVEENSEERVDAGDGVGDNLPSVAEIFDKLRDIHSPIKANSSFVNTNNGADENNNKNNNRDNDSNSKNNNNNETGSVSNMNRSKPICLSKLSRSVLLEKAEKYFMFPPDIAHVVINVVDNASTKRDNTATATAGGGGDASRTGTEEVKYTVEVWQSQKWWRPMQRWSEAMNMPEFVDNLSYNAGSKFPKTVDFSLVSDASSVSEVGGTFEWLPGSEWVVDKSKRYGECCGEGWMYGDSFKNILDMMKNSNSFSDTSSFTKKRRRIWTRTLCYVPK